MALNYFSKRIKDLKQLCSKFLVYNFAAICHRFFAKAYQCSQRESALIELMDEADPRCMHYDNKFRAISD